MKGFIEVNLAERYGKEQKWNALININNIGYIQQEYMGYPVKIYLMSGELYRNGTHDYLYVVTSDSYEEIKQKIAEAMG